MINTKCLNCGNSFNARPCEIKIGKGKFCSPKCVHKWQAKIFKGSKSHVWKGGKSKCICKMCGVEFNLEPAKIRGGRGKFCCRKCKARWQSIFVRGKNHHNWRGGITPENTKIKNSIEYKLWREAVFSRDGWTCQRCNNIGGRLEAHHIKSFAKFLDLRFAIDNGITLCKKCHKETHRNKNK